MGALYLVLTPPKKEITADIYKFVYCQLYFLNHTFFQKFNNFDFGLLVDAEDTPVCATKLHQMGLHQRVKNVSERCHF